MMRRRCLEILQIVGITAALVLPLGGCAGLLLGSSADSNPNPGGGAGSASDSGGLSADLKLAQDVRLAFAKARLPERGDIYVSARDGVVTLTGSMVPAAARAEAERVASRVAGVRQVINAIR